MRFHVNPDSILSALQAFHLELTATSHLPRDYGDYRDYAFRWLRYHISEFSQTPSTHDNPNTPRSTAARFPSHADVQLSIARSVQDDLRDPEKFPI